MSISNLFAEKAVSGLNLNAAPAMSCGGDELMVWLELLFSNRVSRVLMRLAENSRTAPGLLDRLSQAQDADLRIAVSENPNCPQHVLQRLVTDPAPDVRYAMAENHNLPVDLLMELAEDENVYVACRARQTISRIQGFEMLPFIARRKVATA